MKMLKTFETVREREREHNFNELSFTFDAKKEVLVSIEKIEFNRIKINKKDGLCASIKAGM